MHGERHYLQGRDLLRFLLTRYQAGRGYKLARIGLLLFLLLVAGCLGPQLTRRYKSARWAATEQQFIDINAFVIAPPSTIPPPLLLQLSAEGQKALIDAVATNRENNSDIFVQLSRTLGSDESSATIDQTRFRKRIVLSVQRKPGSPYRPADRISDLTIFLALSGGKFISWDRFSTQYDTVDLGKVTLAKNNQLGLQLSGQAPAGSAAAAGSLDYTTSHSQNEEVALRQRYVVLTGTLSPTQAVLTEEGVTGIDLIGTSTIDIDITADAMPPGYYVVSMSPFRQQDKWARPDQITVNWKDFIFPKSCAPISFTMRTDYTVRKVETNDDTTTESDDRVVFLRSATPRTDPVVLVGSQEMTALVWRVVTPAGEEISFAQLQDFEQRALHFSSYDQAIQFLTWLKATRSVFLAGHKLQIGRHELTRAEMRSLGVEVMQLNQCAT